MRAVRPQSPPLTKARCEQWTSFDHPDPTHEQQRTFKNLLLRMQNGTIGDIGPAFVDRVYLPDVKEIKAAEWKRIVEGECFIWMDYFSVSCACTIAQHSRIVYRHAPFAAKTGPTALGGVQGGRGGGA